ncbi:rhodanese-like domain-containing protein [Lacinutrix sp.]|uniref:rhodanese-like domain-containing protein n=1 Tax=Lacinutrix sp. TaxID=1937692 RepID=UPI0025BCC59D|nr:rhodanese-like domain-containing protein [Lacinutrix sp.]
MKKSVTIVVLFMVISMFNCIPKRQQGITVVSTEEKKILLDLDKVQLVDVRTSAEYKAGHIANSQNIDFNSPSFQDDIAALDKEKPVILYCQKGTRSAKCANEMAKAGFKLIYDLEGGFSKWEHINLDLKL